MPFMKKKLVKTGARKGCHTFNVEQHEGGGASSMRRYRIATDDKNQWEVAIWIWDNNTPGWTLSSGQTPEGTFRRLQDALAALKRFVGVS